MFYFLLLYLTCNYLSIRICSEVHNGKAVVTVFTENFIRYISTERRNRLVSTPALYSGGPGFKYRPGDHLS